MRSQAFRTRTSVHSFPASKMLPINPYHWPRTIMTWMMVHAFVGLQDRLVTHNQRQVYKHSHKKKARAWAKKVIEEYDTEFS